MHHHMVRPDCTQLLISCPTCAHKETLDSPWPVVSMPCPACDRYLFPEAAVITTHTLGISKVRQNIRAWLFWHQNHNYSPQYWSAILRQTGATREP